MPKQGDKGKGNGGKGGKGKKGGGAEAPVITDGRFSGMHSMPTFKRVQADKHKVTLDSRFSSVLTDERFRVPEAKYDKYGRKNTTKKASARDELGAFYTLEDKEEGGKAAGGGGGVDGDDSDSKYTGDYVPSDDDDADLAEEEAEMEARKDASSAGKKKGLKPKPVVMKRLKLKPGQTLPADEMERRLAHLNRMARGELDSGDEDSDDSSDSDEDEGGPEAQAAAEAARVAAAGPAQDEPLAAGGETTRLAVCNLDWDHLGAADLFKLVESFMPPGGAVLKVSVYPSDYGLERLKHEERFGPQLWGGDGSGDGDRSGDDNSSDGSGGENDENEEEGEVLGKLVGGDKGVRTKVGLVFGGGLDGEEDDDEDDDDDLSDLEGMPMPSVGKRRVEVAGGYGNNKDYDEDQLRAYELQRAKYYFGVVECDCVATAEALYSKVDGMEWEYSSTTLDLSFIPDSVSFAGRQPRDVATTAPGMDYEAPAFVSAARQQTKVTCTWDEDDPTRAKALDRLVKGDWRTMGDGGEGLEALLANSDSDEEDEAEAGEESEGDGDGAKTGKKGGKKGDAMAAKKENKPKAKKPTTAELRKMMGLGGDSDDDSDGSHGSDSEAERAIAAASDGSGSDGEGGSYSFVSGGDKEARLAELIAGRGKAPTREETPWEKVQRKEAERKKAHKAARKARLASSHGGKGGNNGGDGSESDDDESKMRNATDAEFFVMEGEEERGDDKAASSKPRKNEGVFVSGKKGQGDATKDAKKSAKKTAKKTATKSGDHDDFDEGYDEAMEDAANEAEEAARNYDMRAVVRAEKMAGKKLKGGRAKKEAKRALEAGLVLDRPSSSPSAAVGGSKEGKVIGGKKGARTGVVSEGFKVDVGDSRFSAVLDGGGDGRFGLDPQDAAFKPTSGMTAVLEEQRRRRRERSDAQEKALAAGDVNSGGFADAGQGGQGGDGGGAAGMAALVAALKRRALPTDGGSGGGSAGRKKAKKAK